MSREVSFYEGDILRCPRCGGENLHHHLVKVYQRDSEDSHKGVCVEVGWGQEIGSSGELGASFCASPGVRYRDGNPSSRRSGLRIGFSCEHCGEEAPHSWLLLFQHKGATFLRWEPEDE